jgi:hypothetical protein
MRDYIRDGWTAYYVNFMFNSLRGDASGIVDQMHQTMRKDFYARFIWRFVHDPHRSKERDWLPVLLLFPDRPVWKSDGFGQADIQINAGGLHFNGILLIPPKSRFHECPVEHINHHQSRYIGKDIARIHIVKADRNVHYLMDYITKSLKRGRANPDDILILPESQRTNRYPFGGSYFDTGSGSQSKRTNLPQSS